MLSKAIQGPTGRLSDSQAWDALFKDFNMGKGLNDVGYHKPEKIAIKLNMNQDRRSDWTPDIGNPLHTWAGTSYLPKCVTEARYIINLALMRAHTLFGVMLCGKNHFGTTSFPNDHGWTPSPLHKYGNRRDSMGLDFLRNEQVLNPKVVDVTGNPDNYLHEAALADKPPSGTKYDPEQDGTALKGLGVHEHWNNPKDRKYSRNLKTGNGIELLAQN